MFKVMGLLILFASSSLLGFLKAYNLKMRAEKLKEICLSFEMLGARIKAEKTELERAVKLCFFEETVYIKDNKATINSPLLEKGDISLIEEFFESFGRRDINSEYERIVLFTSLLQKQRKEAEERKEKLSRLYNSLGVLFGIFICIFFL